MELSSQQRVAAPRDFVFAQASDFTAFERQALRRGIEVESRGGPEALGRGWSASVPVMGREREIAAEIVGYAAPEDYTVRGESSGVEILVRVETLPEEELGHSRLGLSVTLAPRSMPGRLVLQSLKLARGSLETRLAGRLEGYAREIEARWARRAG
ncbi:SRPBCC family protein [Limimaricola sp. AA108-03]|uniref:SRPBCC family protein n=1 Tax=Limimaricola sp. AA108-03 TaxID=3425945 RepID=UPI003D77F30B